MIYLLYHIPGHNPFVFCKNRTLNKNKCEKFDRLYIPGVLLSCFEWQCFALGLLNDISIWVTVCYYDRDTAGRLSGADERVR